VVLKWNVLYVISKDYNIETKDRRIRFNFDFMLNCSINPQKCLFSIKKLYCLSVLWHGLVELGAGKIRPRNHRLCVAIWQRC